MITMYKDGKSCSVDRDQVPMMLESGWSLTEKAVKPEPVKPVEVEVAVSESAPAKTGGKKLKMP